MSLKAAQSMFIPPTPFISTSLPSICINMIDMTGRLTFQPLTARSVEVFETKSLIFAHIGTRSPLVEGYFPKSSSGWNSSAVKAACNNDLPLKTYIPFFSVTGKQEMKESKLNDPPVAVADSFSPAVGSSEAEKGTVESVSRSAKASSSPSFSPEMMEKCFSEFSVIESWEDFLKVHQPLNIYTLLPRRARNSHAFCLMREICNLPNSPFNLDQREDPIDFRFTFRMGDLDRVREWNKSSKGMLYDGSLNHVGWDGILIGDNDVGLVTASPGAGSVSERVMKSSMAMVVFLKEWVNEKESQNRHFDLRKKWKQILDTRQVHMFIGGSSPPPPQIVASARQYSIHLFTKDGNRYRYCM